MGFRITLVTLERWSPTAFLVAGGLFALLVVVDWVTLVTASDIAVSPAIIFTALLVVSVGLLGLYPGLAEHDSVLATVGVGLLGVTGAITIPAIGVFLPATAPPVGPATALALVVTVAVGYTLTLAAFGLACLLTGAHSRSVGGFLLVMAGGMAFISVAMVVYGHSTPDWVGFVANGFVATALGSVGYALHLTVRPADDPDTTADVTAS